MHSYVPHEDFIVAIQIEKVLPEIGYVCERQTHAETDFVAATSRVQKPLTNPPLEGPDRWYLCDDCLLEFLDLAGVQAIIL
jgi:hypothetical protein